jgi:hypothetical protein
MFRSFVNLSGVKRMLDIAYLVLGLGCFGLMVGYAKLCSWL